MLLQTALVNDVVKNTRQLKGLSVPDFAEDTPDGKGSTNGTIQMPIS